MGQFCSWQSKLQSVPMFVTNDLSFVQSLARICFDDLFVVSEGLPSGDQQISHLRVSLAERPRLSYLHNLCRFGEANEWSNEPLEPGWASPLTVSGLTRVGRGERLLRASIARRRHVFYPLVRGLPAISGGEPVDR